VHGYLFFDIFGTEAVQTLVGEFDRSHFDIFATRPGSVGIRLNVLSLHGYR
jgi:hypothetical protein